MVFGKNKKLTDEEKKIWNENITKLENSNIGETERLENFRKLIQNGESLSKSDIEYIQKLDKEYHRKNRPTLTMSNNIEGKKIVKYLGIVSGHSVLGINIFSDALTSLRDIVGGRSETYETYFEEAREQALDEMIYSATSIDATAIISVKIDYTTLEGKNKNMLMVSANGTAVETD